MNMEERDAYNADLQKKACKREMARHERDMKRGDRIQELCMLLLESSFT